MRGDDERVVGERRQVPDLERPRRGVAVARVETRQRRRARTSLPRRAHLVHDANDVGQERRRVLAREAHGRGRLVRPLRALVGLERRLPAAEARTRQVERAADEPRPRGVAPQPRVVLQPALSVERVPADVDRRQRRPQRAELVDAGAARRPARSPPLPVDDLGVEPSGAQLALEGARVARTPGPAGCRTCTSRRASAPAAASGSRRARGRGSRRS